MGRYDKLYAILPVWAQHGAVSAFGLYWHHLRFGPGYRESAAAYLDREKFNATQWVEYQQSCLSKLLPKAATTIPYYQEHWTQEEKDAAFTGNLAGLPLLEKDPIRADPEAFVQRGRRERSRQVFLTSGSTGTPISSIYTVIELRDSLAVREIRSANWAGASFQLPRATFSGRMVEPDPNSKGPFYRYNLAERQVYLSPFHLKAETAKQYVQALWKHQIQWLTGYAVSYYLLARFILEQNLEVPPLKTVITTSEKVTPEMRRVMEKAYRCRVYEEYSTVENAIFASECEQGKLHISPDVSIVEILRSDGSACEPGETGEVVVTSLTRTYQLFIRYRLGDLAMWDDRPCTCGRAMPILREIVGRIEDVVVGPDGRQLVRFHGVFVDQPHVKEGQIIQEAVDKIRVKVVVDKGFSSTDIQDIIHRVQQRLTSEVDVQVEAVDFIPRSPSGKFQAVISKVQFSH